MKLQKKKFFSTNSSHQCLVVMALLCCVFTATLLFSAMPVLSPAPAQCEDSLPVVFVKLDSEAPAGNPEPSLKKQDIDPAKGEERRDEIAPTGQTRKNEITPIGQTVKEEGSPSADSEQRQAPKAQKISAVLVLTKAVMCESIKGFEPAESAVTFSTSLGKLFCFTGFENISQNAFVYHKWYHRDRFVATNRFLVKAPQWSTFSTMQLRVADKGPWRVEIVDEKDNLLETLRFSIVD